MEYPTAEEYFASWTLAQAWDRWDKGQKEYALKKFGLKEEQVTAINLHMIRLDAIPGYRKPNDLSREIDAMEMVTEEQ